MNRFRLITIVLLGPAIFLSCNPTECVDFSIVLLKDELPATRLSAVKLDQL